MASRWPGSQPTRCGCSAWRLAFGVGARSRAGRASARSTGRSAKTRPANLEGRGAAVASAGAAGHSHAVPDCRLSLKQVVCFDGQSDVASASLHWASDDERWTLSAAALGRQDRGTLYSSSGDAAYRANIGGVWADVVWRVTPDWTVALRPERLTPKVTLNGVGTALLAREGGLRDAA